MSIFDDSPDVYDIEAWHSSPWRNYRRDGYKLEVPAYHDEDIIQKFYIADEDLVGLHVIMAIKADGVTDYIENISYTNPVGIKYDTYTFNQGKPHSPLWLYKYDGHDYGGTKSLMPGLWYQSRYPDGSGNNDYGDTDNYHAFIVTKEMLKPKVFDGGIHCQMCLPRAAVSTVGASDFAKYVYSKPFTMETLAGGSGMMMALNTQNTMPTFADDAGAGNIALTLELEGCIDKEFGRPERLYTIFDDLDFVSIGAGNSNMLPHMVTLVTHSLYDFFRLKWYVADGVGDEMWWSQSDIWDVSIYSIK